MTQNTLEYETKQVFCHSKKKKNLYITIKNIKNTILSLKF